MISMILVFVENLFFLQLLFVFTHFFPKPLDIIYTNTLSVLFNKEAYTPFCETAHAFNCKKTYATITFGKSVIKMFYAVAVKFRAKTDVECRISTRKIFNFYSAYNDYLYNFQTIQVWNRGKSLVN